MQRILNVAYGFLGVFQFNVVYAGSEKNRNPWKWSEVRKCSEKIPLVGSINKCGSHPNSNRDNRR